ncbi:MAG TPA: ornithine decarboxylase [Roseburia sp.]|nr:ornithine decarboxylase [Roseburia sp.]
MTYIKDELCKLASSDMYPLHMPGHKRRLDCDINPYTYDITEIDGFDNLHAAEGIIKEAEERAAALWGAKQSFFLVNGSTCGILAALSAALPKKGHLLMARNSHKAAYHAAYLRELQVTYLYPVFTEFGIQGGILPEQVEAALEADESIEAVFLTSPTYDGIVSDIEKIAEIAHRHGVPLIVDEAHGAHLGFHPYFPKSAITLGADVVIQSLHKTLPAPTQTAIMHWTSSYIKSERLEWFLNIYETSSPSYLFLASMDECVRLLAEEKDKYFDAYEKRLKDFYQKTAHFTHVEVMGEVDLREIESFAKDPSKLVLRATKAGLSGEELYQLLREKYHLQLEMCQGDYALAMTSIFDSEEGFERLYAALEEIDENTVVQNKVQEHETAGKNILIENAVIENAVANTTKNTMVRRKITPKFLTEAYAKRTIRTSIAEALDAKTAEMELKESIGKMAGAFVYLYPPGIPMLVPGEEISEEAVAVIKTCRENAFRIHGVSEDGKIKVVIS